MTSPTFISSKGHTTQLYAMPQLAPAKATAAMSSRPISFSTPPYATFGVQRSVVKIAHVNIPPYNPKRLQGKKERCHKSARNQSRLLGGWVVVSQRKGALLKKPRAMSQRQRQEHITYKHCTPCRRNSEQWRKDAAVQPCE